MLFTSDKLHLLPETPGIYQFLSYENEILYIGKAKNIKKRISSYFQNKSPRDIKTFQLVPKISFIKIISVIYEFEALLLEAQLIKLYKPKYNVVWRDDKHYLYLKITSEEFPRILFSRRVDGSDKNFFGPFPSTYALRRILSDVRKIFPFCTQKPNSKRSCFYTHIGLCNPCPVEIKKLPKIKYQELRKIYLKNISQIKDLLNGKIGKVKKQLFQEMKANSGEKCFEEAAKIRDKLYDLDYLMKDYYPSESYILDSNFSAQARQKEQKELISILRTYFPKVMRIKRIECYDVSNTHGDLTVGSMITFIDNLPSKKFYRRFRMHLQGKIDDFGCVSELLKRRLQHKEWGMADLLVVDGGTPQCRTFKRVLTEASIDIPFLGIAKEDEAFVVPDGYKFTRIILPASSKALHLIQRVRDEAHRFAHNYHSLLRLKSLFSGVKEQRML